MKLFLLLYAKRSDVKVSYFIRPREFENKYYFAPAQNMKFNSDSKRCVETVEVYPFKVNMNAVYHCQSIKIHHHELPWIGAHDPKAQFIISGI